MQKISKAFIAEIRSAIASTNVHVYIQFNLDDIVYVKPVLYTGLGQFNLYYMG